MSHFGPQNGPKSGHEGRDHEARARADLLEGRSLGVVVASAQTSDESGLAARTAEAARADLPDRGSSSLDLVLEILCRYVPLSAAWSRPARRFWHRFHRPISPTFSVLPDLGLDRVPGVGPADMPAWQGTSRSDSGSRPEPYTVGPPAPSSGRSGPPTGRDSSRRTPRRTPASQHRSREGTLSSGSRQVPRFQHEEDAIRPCARIDPFSRDLVGF